MQKRAQVDFRSAKNYVYPDNDMYDPNLIREETGLSKGAFSLKLQSCLIYTRTRYIIHIGSFPRKGGQGITQLHYVQLSAISIQKIPATSSF